MSTAMDQTRRNFIGFLLGILGWLWVPRAVKAATIPSKIKGTDGLNWTVKSADWLQLQVGTLQVDVVRLHERGQMTEDYSGAKYPWYCPNEWMIECSDTRNQNHYMAPIYARHHTVQSDNVEYVKNEAVRLLLDVQKFNKITGRG